MAQKGMGESKSLKIKHKENISYQELSGVSCTCTHSLGIFKSSPFSRIKKPSSFSKFCGISSRKIDMKEVQRDGNMRKIAVYNLLRNFLQKFIRGRNIQMEGKDGKKASKKHNKGGLEDRRSPMGGWVRVRISIAEVK